MTLYKRNISSGLASIMPVKIASFIWSGLRVVLVGGVSALQLLW